MKKKLSLHKLLTVLIVTYTFLSCNDEIFEADSSSQIKEITIKDGKLYFPNKEAFAEVYKQYVNASDKKLQEYFQPLYKKGFYSLRPIVTDENEAFLYEHYLKLLKNTTVQNKEVTDPENEIFDYLDDLEDIVGDDTFAAFLNNEAEIIVGNEIYKYTDAGLFISKIDKLSSIKDFLEIKNISKDITIKSSDIAVQNLLLEYPNNGLTQVNEDVSYFKSRPDTDMQQHLGPNDGGGGGGGVTPAPGAPVSSDPTYIDFFNNLSSCNPHHGLFGTLFGDNNVCIDKYERKRRVKTKAFNYNYFLVYHLGVKCVHQYKGWTGFWRVESTDEIRLVVEAAQFQYDLDALLGNNAITNQTKERYYFMNNQKAYFTGPNTITFNNQWGTPIISYQNLNSLPSIFQDDLSFEFFGTGWDWLDDQIQDGIDSNLEASNLNEHFYNALYDTATSQLRTAFGNSTATPANRTFVAKFPQNGKLVFQKSVLHQGYGIGVREKTFDWGAEFRFNASTSGEGWKMSGGVGNVLVRPSNFRVKIVGAARRGNSWHGSKFNVGIN